MPPRSVRGFKAAAVRPLRDGLGLSQADVAGLLGVDRGQVYQWETGRKVPTPEHLVGLAKVLQVDPYALFDADPEHPTLHDLRVRLGLSAKALAAAAELPYEAMVHPLDVGRGPAAVSDEVVLKLANALHVEPAQARAACARSRDALLGNATQ
jgi:DNA-binding XRE family transcriptional regulator